MAHFPTVILIDSGNTMLLEETFFNTSLFLGPYLPSISVHTSQRFPIQSLLQTEFLQESRGISSIECGRKSIGNIHFQWGDCCGELFRWLPRSAGNIREMIEWFAYCRSASNGGSRENQTIGGAWTLRFGSRDRWLQWIIEYPFSSKWDFGGFFPWTLRHTKHNHSFCILAYESET